MLLVEECDGGVLRLTLNRPRQHNALSFALLEQLRETLESYARDAALKCVIVTGSGDKSFCAGGDLHELDSMRSLDEAPRNLPHRAQGAGCGALFPGAGGRGAERGRPGRRRRTGIGLRLVPGRKARATGLFAGAP